MSLTANLGLPEGFTEKCNELLPIVTLKNASGFSWDVRIEELEGEGFFLTRGWAKFCQDMKLKLLEVLVFSYDGISTFHVSVFADTALEKNSDFRVIENPHFSVRLRHGTMALRLGFVEASGLTNIRKVRFECPGGQSAEVALTTWVTNGRKQTQLGKGWSGFRKANRLTVGKAYSFEFIPMEKVIRVKPVEIEEEVD